MTRNINLGTRGSRLALYQANYVKDLLVEQGINVTICVISTRGDRLRTLRFQDHLEKGFFTSELETQLHNGDVDIVVHSLKDLPTEPVEGLTVAAYPPRADVSDILLARPDALTEDGRHVRTGISIGTSAARRQALIGLFVPEAKAVDLRGNVPSRIQKCIDGKADAIVLARAGVVRLGLNIAPLIPFDLNPKTWISAPGQGCLAVQCRSDDTLMLDILQRLNDPKSEWAVNIERGVLNRLEGGCHAACGVYTWYQDETMHIKAGAVLAADGPWVVSEIALDKAELQKMDVQGIIDRIVDGLHVGDTEKSRDWHSSAEPWQILD